ncbi:CHAT domain-containing protein [Crocosphaera sp. Alani8]|uniref:CHAT domain-containing protein n=1 Tax=Crocosphaera sp. Alani8 TaxID=3038952 RepID=UPI00313B2D1A
MLSLSIIVIFLIKTISIFGNVVVAQNHHSIRQAYIDGDYKAVVLLEKQFDFDSKMWGYVASAYANLGNYSKAISIVRQLLNNKTVNQASYKINLAQMLVIVGKYQEAKELVHESLLLTDDLYKKAIANKVLGNISSKLGKYQEAVNYYNQGLSYLNGHHKLLILNNLIASQNLWLKKLKNDAELAKNIDTETSKELIFQAKIVQNNQHNSLQEAFQFSKSSGIESLRFRIMVFDENLPYFSQNLSRDELLSEVQELPLSRLKGEFLLKLNEPLAAIKVAETIEDNRLLSFSVGALGKKLKVEGYFSQAKNLFFKAQQIASNLGAWDSLYLWQWEVAKIYRKQAEPEKTLRSYENAINSLSKLRSELISKNQTHLSEQIQPLYLEALEYFLSQAPSQQILLKIKNILKQYQIVLVENYFDSPCLIKLESVPVQQHEAFIYFITLSQKTYILLELPNNQLSLFKIDITEAELNNLAYTWRKQLENGISEDYSIISKKLYSLLIKPLKKDLEKNEIYSLFIRPDGILQNLPFTAFINENDQFLIEDFNIILSVGISQSSTIINKQKGGTLFGLINPPAPLSVLPGVEQEVRVLKSLTSAPTLLDEDFTYNNFQLSMTQSNQSFVHLATHGRFGGNADQTWLQAYDQKIFLSQLEQTLASTSSPLNLLVLSGCETATGNNRTLLGMGGLAVRTGVNRVISTLWSVYDKESSNLMQNFYKNYQTGSSPAKALRNSQLKFLREQADHPYFWAGYVIVR